MWTKIGDNNKIRNANFIEKTDINIEVKEKSKAITTSNNEDGIEKFLVKKLIKK